MSALRNRISASAPGAKRNSRPSFSRCASYQVAPGTTAGPSTRAQLPVRPVGRSEEHTSELQSRLHLVCRLLLEKKNEKKILGSKRTLDMMTAKVPSYSA